MDCPSCGYRNQPDRRHCASCGALLIADTPSVPYLFVHAGPDRGEAFPLDRGRMIAGRARDVEIRLDDPDLAPCHFAVEHEPWQITVEDLDAPHGTIVGRERLDPGDRIAVAPGTFIEAGASLFEIVAAGAEPSLATPKVVGHPHKRRLGKHTRRALVLMGMFLVAVVVLSLVQRGGGSDAAERAKASTVLVASAEGSGSGIVIDRDEGLVLTNHHVVAGSRDAVVGAPGLADGAADATVVATNPCEDVALLRIDGGMPWPEARAIDVATATPRAGDEVFALGYPATAANAIAADGDVSVTGGIVSNPRTRYDDPTSGVMPLQSVTLHDAAINPGSSGGPLVDADGDLLGMNTALYALASFRLEGQSYAITADRIAEILPALRTGDSSGDFGLLLDPYVGALTSGDDPEQPNGLVVRTVDTDGPTAGTGLQEGVLVVRVDGQRVRTLGEWCAATADRNAIAVDFVLPSGQTGSARLRAY